MTFAVEHETQQSDGLGVNEEIHSAIGTLTEDENREGDDFENNVQEEQDKSKVCNDDQPDNSTKDFKKNHGIFSLSLKDFLSCLQNKNNLLLSNMQLTLRVKKKLLPL